MTDPITLSLPYPPSANSIWRSTRSQKSNYLSPAYKAWRALAHAELMGQRPQKVDGPYRLSLVVNRPDRRRRDLSNIVKPVEDLLQAAGIIRDDADCERLMVMWGSLPPSKDARVFAYLRPVFAGDRSPE